MPPNTESCNIPNCDGTAVTPTVPRLDTRRQVRPKDRTDTFREGPVITLATNLSDDFAPSTAAPNYTFSGAGGWLYTEWSTVISFLFIVT